MLSKQRQPSAAHKTMLSSCPDFQLQGDLGRGEYMKESHILDMKLLGFRSEFKYSQSKVLKHHPLLRCRSFRSENDMKSFLHFLFCAAFVGPTVVSVECQP